MKNRILEKQQIKIDNTHLVNRSILISENIEPALKSMFIEIVKDNYPGIISTADLKNKYIEMLMEYKKIDVNADPKLIQIFKNTTSSNMKNSTHFLRDKRIDWLYGKKENNELIFVLEARNTTQIPSEFSKFQGKGNRYYVQYNYRFDLEDAKFVTADEIESHVSELYKEDEINIGIELVTVNPFVDFEFSSTQPSSIRKIDYVKKEKILSEIGLKGEVLALKYEKKRLINENKKDLASKVAWVSSDSDYAGYDIQSYELIDGLYQPIYIEVKTTTKEFPHYFYLSRNELKFSKENNYHYRLYILYDIDKYPKLYIHSGDIGSTFELCPDNYIVYKKSKGVI